jgi:hypothetical protein
VGNFSDVGYAEFSVVSNGKLEGQNAAELRARLKTNDIGTAVFPIDETRQSFVSTESGLPLFTVRKTFGTISPKEIKKSFLQNPAISHDLLSLIFALRRLSTGQTFSFNENDRDYTFSVQSGKSEKVETDAGDFDTSELLLQSPFFDEIGLTKVRLNLSTGDDRIPVLLRALTSRGEIRVALASYKITVVAPVAEKAPAPNPIPIPVPIRTPRPAPTPPPYVDNEALSTELPFLLGETLTFQLSEENRKIANVILRAKERKQFFGSDSLLLTAEISAVEGKSIFAVGDSIQTYVDPYSLVPFRSELKTTGIFSSANEIAQFDQRAGVITNGKSNAIEVPVGTHSLLSLAYAIRAFNLRQSRDPANPVNDTRVALFLDKGAIILSLRSTNNESILFEGNKVQSQLVSIGSGNAAVDANNIRLWLSTDARRLPLRFVFGKFQADLISVNK